MSLGLLLPFDVMSRNDRSSIKPLRFEVAARTSWPVYGLTALLFAFLDMVIDPVALRGDRWFLGKIYYYPDPGWHFGVPFANYVGWAVVGLISLALYVPLDRRLVPIETSPVITQRLLLGIGLYYGVLAFNLGMTFWIGETFMGLSGLLMHLPVLIILTTRLSTLRSISLSE